MNLDIDSAIKWFDELSPHLQTKGKLHWQTLKAVALAQQATMQKMPSVEKIITEVIGDGDRRSLHDTAVCAGINECYRIIVRQLSTIK